MASTGVAAVALTACGGATVDNTDSTISTVAPLPRETQTAQVTSTVRAPGKAEALPQDLPASQVEAIPQERRPVAERDYLDQVADGGVQVAGVEDQLVGAAIEVCREGSGEVDGINVTARAIAGQLIEQKRTDLPVDQVAVLLHDSAKKAYC